MSFDHIEDPRNFKNIMTNTSTSDIFKHENESVDLLLKELIQDPDDINDIINKEPLSSNTSPTKPLKFLSMKTEINSDNLANTKEFNSSSDTYTSETEVMKGNGIKLEQKQQFNTLNDNAAKDDEFLFATPMNSTSNLHSQEIKLIKNTSPSKSIMKKTPGNSPKKNVVFTNSNPEIHRYEDDNSSNNEADNTSQHIEREQTLESEWNELNQVSDEESISPAAIPPPPPPHKSNNFMSLLTMPTQYENNDVDSAMLQSLKSKKNFSNLSLNEKLDMYLHNNNQGQHLLDEHLDDLNDARKSKTESNIHILLSNIQNPSQDRIENPLESLTNDTEVQIRSAGSSQSSLQSLVNDNRVLNSVNIPVMNKGTNIDNGIRGISDDMVDYIMQKTNQEPIFEEEENENCVEKTQSTVIRYSNDGLVTESSSDEERYHDSFDVNNTNTERSIMNLLMASNNELNNNRSNNGIKSNLRAEEEIHDESIIKKETSDNNTIKAENNDDKIMKELTTGIPVDEILLKEEDTQKSIIENNNSNDCKLKQTTTDITAKDPQTKIEDEKNEITFPDNEFAAKNETDDNILDHTNHIDYGEGMKLELVSDFGKGSGGNTIKLVKTNFNKNGDLSNIEQSNEVETSEIVNNSTQVSLRFHMDSDWKLEDSNDGDREDNDDFTHNELTTINHMHDKQNEKDENQDLSQRSNVSQRFEEIEEKGTSPVSEEFRDASDIISHISLAPPKLPDTDVEIKQKVEEDESNEDENALANSSNIAPPEELTLPVIYTDNYSSFEDITKNIDISGNSFEESLSAEHDNIKTPLNYISIWHSQDTQKKKTRKVSNSKPYVIKNIDQPDNEHSTTPRIISEMNKRKFKEINVTSRRIVSPGNEDFNISAFLPELSEDSGFENHFKFLKHNASVYNYSNLSQGRSTNVNTKNILSNINDSSVLHNNNTGRYGEKEKKRTLKPIATEDVLVNVNSKNNKVSKFRVPSFDIQRSNSILSPRNKYDEIFEDVLQEKPTIVGKGMKTLPSMDRNDVQRILNTKKVITQDDFANLKLGNHSKYSVIAGSFDKYDELQQHASIYNASPESTAIDDGVLPHLAHELLKSPGTLLAKDQYFNENPISSNNQVPKDPDPELTRSPVKESHQEKETEDNSQTAVDQKLNSNNPFLEIPNDYKNNSSETTINKNDMESPRTPIIESNKGLNDHNLASSAFNTPVYAPPSNQNSPTKRKAPIKIGSPIKLIKEGSKVTGVETIPTPSRKNTQNSQFFIGGELNNQKIRISPTKSQPESRQLSTVSVPSIYSKKSSQSNTTLTKPDDIKNKQELGQQAPKIKQAPRERGKLFFKVNGIKNINLPDIPSHNAEFSLTLDNGVHCIKTPNYKMAKNVQIGKEFELTVGNSLEFIITLKATYEKPGNKLVEVKERKLVKSKNRISRIFGSKDIIMTTKFVSQQPNDSWRHKFAQDGSFARCYIDLNQFENKINCSATNFDLNCFNEWEVLSSSDGSLTKAKPYRIGQLEVTMLYIPRSDEKEVLPTSIRLAYDITEDTKRTIDTKFEGYLHQEGGDCEVWKRRFFKLDGTSLIAHSEFSHKTRAKINLAKIVEVLYFDEENVTNISNKHRNFSDLLLVQHSFKIKFANGEVIDFSAPNKEEKLHWISILENIIRKNRLRQQPWVNLMLANQTSY